MTLPLLGCVLYIMRMPAANDATKAKCEDLIC
jgi:hypothetical protein